MKKSLWFAMLALLVGALVFANACGDDDDDNDDTTETDVTDTTETDVTDTTETDVTDTTETDVTDTEDTDVSTDPVACSALIASSPPVPAAGVCVLPDAECLGGIASPEAGIEGGTPQGNCDDGFVCCLGTDQCEALAPIAASMGFEAACSADPCPDEALIAFHGACTDSGYCCLIDPAAGGTDSDTE